MMHLTPSVARANLRPTVPTAVRVTVRFVLGFVILVTSPNLYKMQQDKSTAKQPFADPDQRTVILTAENTDQGKDIKPVPLIHRLDLTATAKEIQQAVPIRRMSLPTGLTKDIQPVEPLRPIDLV